MELTKVQEKVYMELSNIIDFNYNDKVALKNRVFDYINARDINLKQALNEIREYIKNNRIGEEHFGNEPYMFETKYGKDILQIIDELGGNDEKN